MLLRIEAEHARGAGIWAEQIQQTLDGRGFARAVAATEAVTFAGTHGERQAVHGIQLAVAPREVLDFDDGRVSVHTGFEWVNAVVVRRKEETSNIELRTPRSEEHTSALQSP